MKTIICIWGASNQGKSETIKGLVPIILNNYPNATTDPVTISYHADIKAIIDIGLLKIGIHSQGDVAHWVRIGLDDLAANACDIIICACRSRGLTLHEVGNMHNKYGYRIIWFANYTSYQVNHSVLNAHSSNQLFETLQEVISGRI